MRALIADALNLHLACCYVSFGQQQMHLIHRSAENRRSG
jgi:hypothetical protein